MYRQFPHSVRNAHATCYRFIITFLCIPILLVSSSIQPLLAQDADGDGFPDSTDNCPFYWNTEQVDSDGDGIGNDCDNCIYLYNPDQTDTDGDGAGDSCEFKDNIGVEFISMTYPHSVNYPMKVVCQIQNLGTLDYSQVIIWYHIENEYGIIQPGPVPMAFPWPPLPSGDTLEMQIDITPPDTGTFRLCWFKFLPDDYPFNDTTYSPWFRTYTSKEGYFAHHSTRRELGWHADGGEGPVVLFDPPSRFRYFGIQTLEIELRGVGDIKFYVYEASSYEDTIPDDGTLLFESDVLSVVQPQQCIYYSIDASAVNELQGLHAPFFVRVEMREENELYWTGAKPSSSSIHSFLCEDGEWKRTDYEYNMKCYIKWGHARPCEGKRGDPTGDGVINVIDVLATANLILGWDVFGDALCRADCNADGVVNILDALNIMHVILGTGSCEP